jgi:hypothetical protein
MRIEGDDIQQPVRRMRVVRPLPSQRKHAGGHIERCCGSGKKIHGISRAVDEKLDGCFRTASSWVHLVESDNYVMRRSIGHIDGIASICSTVRAVDSSAVPHAHIHSGRIRDDICPVIDTGGIVRGDDVALGLHLGPGLDRERECQRGQQVGGGIESCVGGSRPGGAESIIVMFHQFGLSSLRSSTDTGQVSSVPANVRSLRRGDSPDRPLSRMPKGNLRALRLCMSCLDRDMALLVLMACGFPYLALSWVDMVYL